MLNNLHQKISCFFLVVMIFIFPACSKNKALPPQAPKENKAPVNIVKVEEPIKEKRVYVYQGDKYRDPFMPAGVSSAYQSNTVFDPKRITIKAIIVGNTLNSAILSQGNSISYFVRSGNIIDIMGKKVQGFKANVYENKVVLIGDEENTYEIKIRNSEKEEKAL